MEKIKSLSSNAKKIISNLKWYHYCIIFAFLSIIIITIVFVVYKRRSKRLASGEIKTKEKFENTQPEIILYYTNWCGYSRKFMPEWTKFEEYAKDNLKNIRVSKVLCENGNESVCRQKEIAGYPTVMLYLLNDTEIQYSGEQTMDGVIEFVKKHTS